jgi:hypothetical protein
MQKLMLRTALCAALGLPLGAGAASAKAGDPSPQLLVCRLAATARPLKLLRFTVLAENGMSSPTERINRRAIYTPMPKGADAFMVLLERQSTPASLIVGVGY